jgi:hypothetical protein
MWRTSTYTVWLKMRQRCTNKKDPRWSDYGGRGIVVCKRWNDFTNFLADMGIRPSSDHSIDRIDNDGSYSPNNCRWATRKEQRANQRDGYWQRVTKMIALRLGHSTAAYDKLISAKLPDHELARHIAATFKPPACGAGMEVYDVR